ncbi:MAG: DGQHR domain-containing protein [Bradyrhizobiaceae bacterium]|nr:MAG: DGQHR domain-containing protein [Bradyrhizobiaceae bacterium]
MIEESPRSISFPVIKITQPIGEFYVGAIAAKDLVEIAYFDIRQLNLQGNIDTYLGIQRRLNETRIREISQYVNTIDATFPTAVILAVEEKCASLRELKLAAPARASESFYELTLQNFPGELDDSNTVLFRDIARVIDGQHRIAGLMNLTGNQAFEINVAIFVGADIADQAAIFSTVNLAQTKVNRSLVYDLFEYSKTRSPEKTCHDVAVLLDRAAESPFYEKIKRLGVATEGRFGETISQATFVKSLLRYISENPIIDRDLGKRRGKWSQQNFDRNRLIFREFFVTEKDESIALNVWNYFAAAGKKWPGAWSSAEMGLILNKTNGFLALMRFLRPVYLHLNGLGKVISEQQFLSVFDRINLRDGDFNRQKYLPGTSGETSLYKDLLERSALSERSDFK